MYISFKMYGVKINQEAEKKKKNKKIFGTFCRVNMHICTFCPKMDAYV